MTLDVLGSSSKGNCYVLTTNDNKERLVLEAGVPLKKVLKACKFKKSSIKGCLITHEHGDHSKYVSEFTKMDIPTYSTKGTKEVLKEEDIIEISDFNLDNQKFFSCGSFKIMSFKTIHDAAEPCGYVIYHKEMGQLLFVTDTAYLNYRLPGLSAIMIECNYSDELMYQADSNTALKQRIRQTHLSLSNCEEILEDYHHNQNIKQVVLLHCSSQHGDKKEFTNRCSYKVCAPVYFAEKGLNINIGNL